MNRYILTFVIIIFIIIGAFFNINLFKKISKEKRTYESFNFPSTIVLKNYTDIDNIDFYIKLILHKILEIDTVNITFFYTYSKNEYLGFIKKAPGEKNYIIFLSRKITPIEIEIVLAHELVHLDQMERGDFFDLPGNIVLWQGKFLNLKYIDYYLRPYEIEAFKKEFEYQNRIKEILNE